jgi:hypothetical protein
MPDYASILRRSIAALPEPGPDMREAVYQRARAALARQLTAVDPPLSTREIELQHQELEDAVARLEAEYAPQESPEPLADVFGKDEFLYSAPQNSGVQLKQPPPPPPRGQVEEEASGDYEAEDDEDEDYQDEGAGGRAPLLIGAVLVLLVVVGLGAYAFAQRASIMAFFGFGGSEEIAGAEVPPPTPATAGTDTEQPEPDKLADRLTNGTAAAPPETPPTDTALAEPETSAPALEEPPAEQSLAPPQDEQTAALPDPGTSLVEQRAIYYYQGAEGSAGTASEGNATWAEITKEGRPAIQATLRIAERDVTVSVTIYKNYDEQLPASHLVEIQFTGTLAASPIQRVPALVLKQTEQARGEPLAGAAVPVTNELFWIALSDDAEQVDRNIQLLRDGSWFDIPILFSDQTRALITFEKGIPGDRVFETVMSTWTPS